MTIAAEDTRVKYTCNGILTDFDFTFKIFSEDDIAVIVTDSDGDETLLALTTDFTVEGVNGDFTNGGTVSTVKDIDGTMTAYAWSADYEITIMLAIDLEQETDLIYAGGYSSRSVETMSDRLTKICQQLAEKLGRALKFKKTSDEVDVEFPDLIPNKFIRVNSDGDGLEMGGTTAEVDEDKISNIAYGVSWDGITDVAPSKNAVYDQMEVVMDGLVSDDPYDATTWNGETDTAPSKNAVRDKIETIVGASISDVAYDATTWDDVTDVAPSKNAVRDKIETMGGSAGGNLGSVASKTIASNAITLASTEHIVALTGEGNVADDLTAITKTGGGDLDAGHLVVLKGKAGLAYDITINDNDDLRIQTVFTINSEYDSITLVCVGSGVFIEIARSSNA